MNKSLNTMLVAALLMAVSQAKSEVIFYENDNFEG
jgi:hypothetical protein